MELQIKLMSELLPQPTKENKSASYQALMVLFNGLKKLRLNLEDEQHRWNPAKEEQRAKLDDRLAKLTKEKEALKN